MSDFYKDKAPIGTVIKSLREFAVMDEDGHWIGSLQYMHPGQGYFVRYLGSSDTRIYYTNIDNIDNVDAAVAAKHAAVSFYDTDDEALDISVCETAHHAQSMPVIAEVGDDIDFRDGDMILAYTKGEVAAMAEPTLLRNGRRLFFLSLNAEDGDIVRFAHIRDGQVIAKSANGVTFSGDTVTGTLDVPYTIDFSDRASSGDNVYDISGHYYGNERNVKHRHGIFIINNTKVNK